MKTLLIAVVTCLLACSLIIDITLRVRILKQGPTSPQVIRRLAANGDLCNVVGHRWVGESDTQRICTVCGYMETKVWKGMGHRY